MTKAGMGLEFSCGENPALVPAVATPYGSSGLTPDQYVDHMEKALQGANTTRARSQRMTGRYRGGEAQSRELRARTSDTPGPVALGSDLTKIAFQIWPNFGDREPPADVSHPSLPPTRRSRSD